MLKNFFLAFLLILSTCFTVAHSDPNKEIAKAPFDSTKIWLAIPASAFIGFGLGQAIQDRYSDYGWAYTTADSAGYLLFFLTFGDCRESTGSCQDNKDRMRETAAALLITSRITQLIDTSIWSYKYYNKYPSVTFIVPAKDEIKLAHTLWF